MFNIWSYLARKTAEAMAKGAADFLAAVTPEGDPPPADLDEIRKRLAAVAGADAKALPAAEEEPAKKGRAK